MQREPRIFLEDIYSAAKRVEKYTKGLSYDDFIDNDLVSDAVIKNILVIGKAKKKSHLKAFVKNNLKRHGKSLITEF